MQAVNAPDPWRSLKQLVFWTATAASAVLAVLSVVGAFLGAERAADWFNSPPMAVFWLAVLGSLLAAVVLLRSIWRRPASLAMHVGCILVLAGSMWGSQAGHELAAKCFGIDKIRSGYLAIEEGQAADDVYSLQDGRPLGRLPLQLRLAGFWIDYYPPKTQAWALLAVPAAARDEERQWEEKTIDGSVGKEQTIPWTQTRVRVLEYLASARAVYPDGAPFAVCVFTEQGLAATIPALAGKEASLDSPQARIVIARVFSRLIVTTDEQGRTQVLDAPSPPYHHAVQVRIELPDGRNSWRYVYASQAGTHEQDEAGITLRMVGAEPSAVVPDDATHLPAMKIRLSRPDGRSAETWLAPREGQDHAGIDLGEVLTGPREPRQREVKLVLAKPPTPIKSFNSDVAVLLDGREVKRQVVQVNHPLHYGGYHFYQHSYDETDARGTVLSVSSDSGLWSAYAGFALLTAGTFGHFWVRPALRRLRRSAGHGH